MNLSQLIRSFRVLAQDQAQFPLWADEDVVGWINEAQAQACVRGRLLHEDGLAEVCRIPLTVGTSAYPLHPAALEITHARLLPPTAGRARPLSLVSREWLDAELPDWRDAQCPAAWLVQADTGLRLVGAFEAGTVLALECYRLPMTQLALAEGNAEPEIHRVHHEHLVQWALHKAFGIPDADGFDPTRADKAERAFTAYFGPMPDSDLRRATRTDQPQYNRDPYPV